MWRSILAVLLVPSMVWGEEQSLSTAETQETVTTKGPRPTYRALIEPRTIRPGKTVKAEVVLFLGQGFFVSRNESSRDLFPMKVELEDADGVTASSLSFPTDRCRNFAFHDEAMRKAELLEPPDVTAYGRSATSRAPGVATPSRTDGAVPPGEKDLRKIRDTRVRILDGSLLRVSFKLKASKAAPLGEHLLRAKVTVQSISDSGVVQPRQIEVQLPVTVVNHDTEAKSIKTARSDAGGTPVLIWILMPLLIPLMVVMGIVCGIRGEDCSC
ncbi:MAG TPA: hypothetical protein VJP02_07545 [Candidatus Sulfotelmatobacter sp.]|nr:hypothetical protein [Candidatus Sulfotelmatobacter sp.]